MWKWVSEWWLCCACLFVPHWFHCQSVRQPFHETVSQVWDCSKQEGKGLKLCRADDGMDWSAKNHPLSCWPPLGLCLSECLREGMWQCCGFCLLKHYLLFFTLVFGWVVWRGRGGRIDSLGIHSVWQCVSSEEADRMCRPCDCKRRGCVGIKCLFSFHIRHGNVGSHFTLDMVCVLILLWTSDVWSHFTAILSHTFAISQFFVFVCACCFEHVKKRGKIHWSVSLSE